MSNLDPSRVSVVDQAGRLLSARVDVKDGIDNGSFADEAARKAQNDILQNAHQLLQPLLGAGNYNVSVAVELGQDRVQETQERYGDSPKVTNEASREESNRDRVALGVPGSLSNRPATPAPAANEAPNTAERSAVTRQFAYDRSVTTIQRARGQLKKLSVAVVLNEGAAPGGAASWGPQEIARMEGLLRGGLGINAERGDQLVVSALAFPGAAPAVPWYAERETVFEFVTWGLYVLGALLGYFLLARPLLRLLRERNQPAEVGMTDLIALEGGPGAADETPALAQPSQAVAALPNKVPPSASGAMVPLLADYDLPPPGSPVEVLVNHLKVLAQKEPERVAEVVKQWVQKNAATT